MAAERVRVAILEDHQVVIDGYAYRLGQSAEIEIVGAVHFGEHLEHLLARTPVDVAIMDLMVPTTPTNRQPYPLLHALPRLQQLYPTLAVLIISMLSERPLIKSLIEAGASGYILKDDIETAENLVSIVQTIARGDVFFSRQVTAMLVKYAARAGDPALTARQLEALSLSSAYPGEAGIVTARRMGISYSTLRNLLSTAYLRLGVSNRAEAILKARELGLITPDRPPGAPRPTDGGPELPAS